MHMGNNGRGEGVVTGSYLWREGVQHVAREIGSARSRERVCVARALLDGLAISVRPKDFADGVRAACEAAIATAE